jgi:hypothetical protein
MTVIILEYRQDSVVTAACKRSGTGAALHWAGSAYVPALASMALHPRDVPFYGPDVVYGTSALAKKYCDDTFFHSSAAGGNGSASD